MWGLSAPALLRAPRSAQATLATRIQAVSGAAGGWEGRSGCRHRSRCRHRRQSLPTHSLLPPRSPVEVRPVKSDFTRDVTKRGGRWESDFIWNKVRGSHTCSAAVALPSPTPLPHSTTTSLTPPLPTPFPQAQDWAKQLDYEESLRKQQAEGRNGGAKQQPGKGFLSLTSRVDLNSMDVDLSEQLRARRKSGGDASPSSTATPNTAPQRKRQPVRYGSVPPTRVEQRAWERGGKFSRKVVAVPPTNEAEQVRMRLCRLGV